MVDFGIEVLTGKDNDKVQFWANGSTDNSVFPEILGVGHEKTDPIYRTTKRLDTARERSFLKDERVDILKLDVQGAELTVLQGAGDILKEVSFVQFEASVVEYNKGGSCNFEVDEEFLREHGFYLYNFGDIMRNNAHAFHSPGVGQYDALYIRPTSEHLPPLFAELKDGLFCGSNRSQGKVSSLLQKSSSKEAEARTGAEEEESTPCLSTSSMLQNPTLLHGHVDFGSLLAGILAGIWIAKYILPKCKLRPNTNRTSLSLLPRLRGERRGL